ILVKRDINGVEERRILFRCNTGVSRGNEHPGAVEMQLDVACSRPLGDSLHLLEVENLAVHSSHRALDRNRSDLKRKWAISRAQHGILNLRHRKGRLVVCQRNQVQMADRLDAVERIAIDVTFTLNQHTALALTLDSESQVIRQRASWHEHGTLFSEHLGERLLQFLDRSAGE